MYPRCASPSVAATANVWHFGRTGPAPATFGATCATSTDPRMPSGVHPDHRLYCSYFAPPNTRNGARSGTTNQGRIAKIAVTKSMGSKRGMDGQGSTSATSSAMAHSLRHTALDSSESLLERSASKDRRTTCRSTSASLAVGASKQHPHPSSCD